MNEPLCLLTVHAHPDDESSKGAATVARYAAAGVRTVLVCCTGGEEGDILNPAMDRPEIREDLPAVRGRELAAAVAAIGYSEVVELGYRDSGMPGSEANANPDCFAAVDLDEAVGRLVAVIRRTRPQVVVTYHEDQQGYPHPDHLRVHDISVLAFDRAADPLAYPYAGEPWQPLKLYYTMWSRRRVVAMHEKFLELELESPFTDRWLDRPSSDPLATTTIDITGYAHVRREALMAHATQIDPTSPFWFGLPAEVADTVHPFDEYTLARSLVDAPVPEDDLFAGIEGARAGAPGNGAAPAQGASAADRR
jgi:mycothiol S-conjugate amidase